MVRVITQETYDEVVKENMEEFDMTPEEAIKEATAQFEAQGVDLSNIIKDLVLGSGEDHLVSMTVNKLRELCTHNDCDNEQLIKELDILKTECNKDLAHRVRAGKDGAYKILIDLLEVKYNRYIKMENETNGQMVLKIVNTLIALMDTHPDLLDQRGINLVISLLEIDNEDILISTLKWMNVCCLKHEMNRQKIFARNITNKLKFILDTKKNDKTLNECLRAIRRFTLDDDVRVQFGKAHEQARELGASLLPRLTQLLKDTSDAKRTEQIMRTMKALLVRHELCALLADGGTGLSTILTLLTDYFDNSDVVEQAINLMTALAGNDDVKRAIIRIGSAAIIISLLSTHSVKATTSAVILKCIAALVLREPTHSQEFFENGAAEVIVEAMKAHPEDPQVQKNGCWAIRNMVARCREQKEKFHELGAEALLNLAYQKYENDFGFDIKSALRDLECEVKLDEPWKGKGVQMENVR